MKSLYPYCYQSKTQSNEQPHINKQHLINQESIKQQSDKCNNRCSDLIPSKAILKCNEISYGPTNLLTNYLDLNELIASVTIDTTCLHCPNTLIDFSGILSTLSFNVTSFSFTLFKSCKGNSFRQAVTTFNFNTFNNSDFADSNTIKFKYLSCDDQYGDCCTYTLELTRVTSGFGELSQFSINGMMCAFAVDSQH